MRNPSTSPAGVPHNAGSIPAGAVRGGASPPPAHTMSNTRSQQPTYRDIDVAFPHTAGTTGLVDALKEIIRAQDEFNLDDEAFIIRRAEITVTEIQADLSIEVADD